MSSFIQPTCIRISLAAVIINEELNYQNIGVLSDDVAAMQKANITNSEMPIVENIRAGRLRYLHDEPPTKGDFFLFYCTN